MRLNKHRCLEKRKQEDVTAFKYVKGAAKKKEKTRLLCQGRVAIGLNFSKENSN